MTDREKAIVEAFTGVVMLVGEKRNVFYDYVFEIIGRPIFTQQIPDLADEIKEKATPDFINLCKTDDASVRIIVNETIAELRRQDRLKENEYGEAADLITAYYNGDQNRSVEQAIAALCKDNYFKILPLYFRDGYTIEQLAVAFDCEVSTISRNKKRLCLEVYRRVK